MRSYLPRLLLSAAVVAVLVATGAVHGLITGRWEDPGANAPPPLARVPMTIGDWSGDDIQTEAGNMPPVGVLDDMILRRYVHRTSGAAVLLFLGVGRTGPVVSAHAPDSCYPGAGYTYFAPVSRYTAAAGPDGQPQEFRVAGFSKTQRASPIHVRVFWSWSGNGTWEVPASPRVHFAGQRRVFKLYVISPQARPGGSLDDDPALGFIQAAVPALKKALFAGT